MQRPLYQNNHKLDPVTFLPHNNKRIGEGGLRYQSNFKRDNKQPLLTVLTVVFNGAETLERTILSVINQSYDNVEFIIIDGGSTDGTLDIIRKYEHVIDYWLSEPDDGIYDAFNKAVRCASGDWLCFIGADDYLWDDDVLSNIAPSLLNAPPELKLIYGSVAIINSRQEPIYHTGEPWEAAKSKWGFSTPIPHQGLLHRRSWFEQYGLYDTTFRIAGDYENLLRGYPNENALFIPDLVVTGMALGGVSSTPKNSIKSLKEMYFAQRKHLRKTSKVSILLAFTRVYMRFILQSLLGERFTHIILDFGRKLRGKPAHWTKL